MDAVSGVAAAVQLADLGFRSLFKIYSVVRDATEVPKRLKTTLSDIESFQNLLERLQEEAARPSSKLASESTQTTPLITTLTTAASCANALSQSLEKILPPASGSRLKRAWRALATIPKEDGILLQCERLHKLKQDLQLELHLIGISLIGFDRERTGGNKSDSLDLEVTDEKSNVVELSVMSIESLAQSLRQMLISEHQSTDVLYSVSTVKAEERRQAATRCCFQLIQYPSDLAHAAEALETQQTAYNIRSSTSILGPFKFCACQYQQNVSTNNPLGLFEAKSTSTTFHGPTCKVFASTRWKNEYAIRLSMKPFLDKTYELILQSSSGAGGSSFSRTLKSFRTVGRLSSPAFKIFDAFNNLGSEDCTETFKKLMVYQTKQNPLRIQRGKGGDITYQTWHSTERLIYDAALICPHPEEGIVVWLQALPIVLEEIFRSGDSLPTDRDEFGNTLLHEIIFTWHYIGKKSPTISRHIQKVARYLYSRGADLGAASTPITRTSMVKGGNQTFSFEVSSNPDMSIADLTYLALLNSFQTNVEISNVNDFIPIPYSLVSEIGSHIDSSFLSRVEYRGTQLTTKSGLLNLIVSNSSADGVVDDIELGPLHHVILQRSMEKLIKQMKKKKLNEGLRRDPSPFNAVECAIGWDEGLVVLAEAGYDIQDALQMAVFRGDISTVRTLFSCDADIGDTPLDCALCLQCRGSRAVSRGHDRVHSSSQVRYRGQDSQRQIMELIVESMKARRESLYSLALDRLPVSIFQALGLENRLLDSDARRTEEALKDCGMHIPYSLKPSRLPIYHTFNICCPQGGIDAANLLYESGFKEVDALDNRGRSPLLITIKMNQLSGGINWNKEDASAILWLLKHGADVDNPDVWKDTPLIHHLGSLFDGVRVKQWNWSEDSSFLRLLRRYPEQPARETSIPRTRDRSESSLSYLSDNDDIGSCYEEIQRPENRDRVEVIREKEQHDPSEGRSEGKAPSVASSRASTDDSWASWETGEDVVNPRLAETLKLVHKKTRNLTDGCICYCSVNGCLPLHHIPVLYDRASTKGSVKSWATIEDDVFLWIELCEVSETQAEWYIEQACRLEMFERLGMAHTCCRRPARDGTDQSAVSDELRDELQKEDQESKEQLELLMEEFKRHMESSKARRLFVRWTSWWGRVDEILPPLLPWERGLRYCATDEPMELEVEQALLNVSEERFGDQLERAGYKGMDFIDVIEAHFEKHVEV